MSLETGAAEFSSSTAFSDEPPRPCRRARRGKLAYSTEGGGGRIWAPPGCDLCLASGELLHAIARVDAEVWFHLVQSDGPPPNRLGLGRPTRYGTRVKSMPWVVLDRKRRITRSLRRDSPRSRPAQKSVFYS